MSQSDALDALRHEFDGRTLLLRQLAEEIAAYNNTDLVRNSVFIIQQQHNDASRAAQSAVDELGANVLHHIAVQDNGKEMRFIQVSAESLYKTLKGLDLGDCPAEPIIINGKEKYTLNTLCKLLSMGSLFVSWAFHFNHLAEFATIGFDNEGLDPSSLIMLLTSDDGTDVKFSDVTDTQWKYFVAKQNAQLSEPWNYATQAFPVFWPTSIYASNAIPTNEVPFQTPAQHQIPTTFQGIAPLPPAGNPPSTTSNFQGTGDAFYQHQVWLTGIPYHITPQEIILLIESREPGLFVATKHPTERNRQYSMMLGFSIEHAAAEFVRDGASVEGQRMNVFWANGQRSSTAGGNLQYSASTSGHGPQNSSSSAGGDLQHSASTSGGSLQHPSSGSGGLLQHPSPAAGGSLQHPPSGSGNSLQQSSSAVGPVPTNVTLASVSAAPQPPRRVFIIRNIPMTARDNQVLRVLDSRTQYSVLSLASTTPDTRSLRVVVEPGCEAFAASFVNFANSQPGINIGNHHLTVGWASVQP